MKIENASIHNWEPTTGNPPGNQWWKDRDKPDEAESIDATIRLRLSYNEYQQLLRQSRMGTETESPIQPGETR